MSTLNTASAPLTRTFILQKTWPIILANAAVPTLGLVDTAVIGNLGTATDLGAIALGSAVFSFVFWPFGFLRMGTTGFAAQAAGAGEEAEVRATLGRALLIAIVISGLLLLCQWPLASGIFHLLDGSAAVEASAEEYFHIRIWGAPATLATFALVGLLIGLGKSKLLLLLQLFLNGLNITLDIYLVAVLDMGVQGIALGTVIAEWTTLAAGLVLITAILRERHHDSDAFLPWPRLFDAVKLRQTLAANTDIMIRTLALVSGFVWFANQGAAFGDTTLAANHILLQIISFCAFFLDGFAFAVESLVGSALGARQRDRLRRAIWLSSQLAVGTAVLLGLSIILFGDRLVAVLTNLEEVRITTATLLPWCATYVVLSVAAFQLDGIFIGATCSREMRNAALQSIAVFLFAAYILTPSFGNDGLWWAFIIYVVARAAALLRYYGSVEASIAQSHQSR